MLMTVIYVSDLKKKKIHCFMVEGTTFWITDF